MLRILNKSLTGYKFICTILLTLTFMSVSPASAGDYLRSSNSSTSFKKELPQADYYVFVSFSMNDKDLIEITKEAKNRNGLVVLRGFENNDLKQTYAHIYKIVKKSDNGFIIDPDLFKRFEVNQVPTFVSCEQTEICNKLGGNVKTGFALSKINGVKK